MQYYTATAHVCPPQQCVHAEGFLWILMVTSSFRVPSGFAFWPPGYAHAGSEFPCEMFDCKGSHKSARQTHIWRSTFTCAPCPFLGLCAICPARETSKTFWGLECRFAWQVQNFRQERYVAKTLAGAGRHERWFQRSFFMAGAVFGEPGRCWARLESLVLWSCRHLWLDAWWSFCVASMSFWCLGLFFVAGAVLCRPRRQRSDQNFGKTSLLHLDSTCACTTLLSLCACRIALFVALRPFYLLRGPVRSPYENRSAVKSLKKSLHDLVKALCEDLAKILVTYCPKRSMMVHAWRSLVSFCFFLFLCRSCFVSFSLPPGSCWSPFIWGPDPRTALCSWLGCHGATCPCRVGSGWITLDHVMCSGLWTSLDAGTHSELKRGPNGQMCKMRMTTKQCNLWTKAHIIICNKIFSDQY